MATCSVRYCDNVAVCQDVVDHAPLCEECAIVCREDLGVATEPLGMTEHGRSVWCPNEGCTRYEQLDFVVDTVVVPGVIARPPLFCLACGWQVTTQLVTRHTQ